MQISPGITKSSLGCETYCETIEIRDRSSVLMMAQIRLATSSWKVSVNVALPNAHGPLRFDINRRRLQVIHTWSFLTIVVTQTDCMMRGEAMLNGRLPRTWRLGSVSSVHACWEQPASRQIVSVSVLRMLPWCMNILLGTALANRCNKHSFELKSVESSLPLEVLWIACRFRPHQDVRDLVRVLLLWCRLVRAQSRCCTTLVVHSSVVQSANIDSQPQIAIARQPFCWCSCP